MVPMGAPSESRTQTSGSLMRCIGYHKKYRRTPNPSYLSLNYTVYRDDLGGCFNQFNRNACGVGSWRILGMSQNSGASNPLLSKSNHIHSRKLTWNPKKKVGRFGKWFSVSKGWFSGSMLVSRVVSISIFHQVFEGAHFCIHIVVLPMNISYHRYSNHPARKGLPGASSDLAGSVVEGHPAGSRECFHYDKRKQPCLVQAFVAPMADLIDCEESWYNQPVMLHHIISHTVNSIWYTYSPDHIFSGHDVFNGEWCTCKKPEFRAQFQDSLRNNHQINECRYHVSILSEAKHSADIDKLAPAWPSRKMDHSPWWDI